MLGSVICCLLLRFSVRRSIRLALHPSSELVRASRPGRVRCFSTPHRVIPPYFPSVPLHRHRESLDCENHMAWPIQIHLGIASTLCATSQVCESGTGIKIPNP